MFYRSTLNFFHWESFLVYLTFMQTEIIDCSANKQERVSERRLVCAEIYNLGDDEELLMMSLQFLVVLLRGMLESLTRNGKEWPTNADG